MEIFKHLNCTDCGYGCETIYGFTCMNVAVKSPEECPILKHPKVEEIKEYKEMVKDD